MPENYHFPMVVVEEDFVMQRVLREQGAKLVERVDDEEILQVAWAILHRGELDCPPSEQLKPRLQEAFVTAQPYRLAYEAWRTLQDHLEPSKPPSPELEGLARRLDSLFGLGKAEQRIKG